MADYGLDIGLMNPTDAWKDDLKDIAILGASAAGAIVAYKFAVAQASKITALQPYLTSDRNRAIGAIVIGAAAGVGLGQTIGRQGGMGRGIAAGVATGLVGYGAAHFASQALKLADIKLAGLEGTDDLLLGVDVEDYRALPGQMNGIRDIEAQPGLASWLA